MRKDFNSWLNEHSYYNNDKMFIVTYIDMQNIRAGEQTITVSGASEQNCIDRLSESAPNWQIKSVKEKTEGYDPFMNR